MKKIIYTLVFLPLVVLSQNTNFTELKGSYLGQSPPDTTSEIFAPGIVSTSNFLEVGCTWMPDLKEFYFSRSETLEMSSNWSIWYVREEDGVLSKPQIASFSGVFKDVNPYITPDGKHLIFFRMNNNEKETRMGSWIVDRIGNTWSEPRFFYEAYCMTTADFQTFYFTTDRSDETSKDIAQINFKDGVFSEPLKLPGELNSKEWEAHSCISPDGNYMLFDRVGSTFVSFKKEDETWSCGYNLGDKYYGSSFSPDGKYIFFESGRNIYWISTKIIEDLKPKN